MIVCVVGHRGVGKTTLANRLRAHYQSINGFDFVDLDNAIEKRTGKKIFEIFIDHGEKYFRDLEQQMFTELLQSDQKNLWVVLGAGFDVSKIPADTEVLWVRRETDKDGRIFLDRPRLDENVRPLEEYLKRFPDRELAFKRRATWVYLMPEGRFDFRRQALTVERELFFDSFSPTSAILTLLPEMFEDDKWALVAPHLQGRYKALELRDDLLNLEQMRLAVETLSQESFVYSYRTSQDCLLVDFEADLYDWALELGPPSEDYLSRRKESRVLSLHSGKEVGPLMEAAHLADHLKWAPEVFDWAQLALGHEWQQEGPMQRSFLPRSQNGRWSWYRLLMMDKMKINFVRDFDGSAADQPSLFQVKMRTHGSSTFAAVLGAPVAHSWTPLEHSEFFYKRSVPVFSIHMDESEVAVAMPLLQNWGLQYAAVTSPLKKAVASWARASQEAVNTLFLKETQVFATSTDAEGFRALVEGVGELGPISQNVVVWGGGGTLASVDAVLPEAAHYSSRTGLPRDPTKKVEHPRVVIWAAPRHPETQMPPRDWRPAIIYDLNYKEDSLGLEYAQISRARYESGAEMFRVQAQVQRIFWEQCEEKQ